MTESTPSSPAAQAAQPPPKRKENVKETIESILVAFILAFVFRAFVVEAFVIPSGSMATTLLGAHTRYRCEECGMQFDANFSTPKGDDNSIPGATVAAYSVHCPNCGLLARRKDSRKFDPNEIIPVHYGDRILVLKYVYLLHDPARWDVVVFKTPAQPPYDVNFIKRLVGLPGEWIMVCDGDLFAAHTPENVLPTARDWQIQTKPRIVQEALWRIAFDNDFQPVNGPARLPQWNNPWKFAPQGGWSQPAESAGRVFAFDNLAGQSALTFDKDANPGTYPLTDWLPYSEAKGQKMDTPEQLQYWMQKAAIEKKSFTPPDFHNLPHAYDDAARQSGADYHVPRWNVSDLKLKFVYERKAGDGELRLTLSRLDDAFTAILSPATAKIVRTSRTDPAAAPVEIGSADLTKLPAGTLDVEFANVDYRVSLRINGQDILHSTPEQYSPAVTKLLEKEEIRQRAYGPAANRDIFPPPSVSISAQKQSCRISHLSLWRDVYYTPSYEYGAAHLIHAAANDPIYLHKAGQPVPGRAGAVFDDEFFVLGDNSILSSDARAWQNTVDLIDEEALYVQSGRVPRRFMMGKAFFVYWPAGHRLLSPNSPGLVPNFGEMRFIH